MGLTEPQRHIRTILIAASAWALFFYLFMITPFMMWLSARSTLTLGLGLSAVIGALSRSVSRRAWPVGLGWAAGLILGADRAYVADTLISQWEHLCRSITSLSFYPVWVWLAAMAAWVCADAAIRRWQRHPISTP